MQLTKVATEFLTLLKKSKLLSPDDLQDAVFCVAQMNEPSSEEIARHLVEDGFLTQYQADRLREGEFRGLVIDGYRVLEVLGVGGMGWVYIAEEVQTRWRVALKVLPDHARQDRGTIARFRLEAEAGMRLNHPNIVRSYKLGQMDDRYGPSYYVVMELVRGVNLFEFMLMKKQLDIGHACDIVMQTAEGLAYAHAQGMIHRDIKPENILVCGDGSVKILDFGLAMVDENDEEFSMAMIFGQNRLGTADYISPEQYIDSYEIDPRADIYSLGCTLYFALTGKVPFPLSSSAEKLRAHLKKKATPVHELRPEVPHRLSLIVQKMMAKHPENRVQSAADVARYLKSFAQRQQHRIDFRSVLDARMAHARRRLTKPSGSQSGSQTGSGAGSGRQSASPGMPTSRDPMTMETIVREDTMLDQPRPRSSPLNQTGPPPLNQTGPPALNQTGPPPLDQPEPPPLDH